jgi:predicted transcriptional regulator
MYFQIKNTLIKKQSILQYETCIHIYTSSNSLIGKIIPLNNLLILIQETSDYWSDFY